MSRVSTKVRPFEPIRRGAILIVDDDKRTRSDVRERVAAEFGDTYEVLEAEDTREAANLLKSLRDQGSLQAPVIATALPSVSGKELSLAIRDQRPAATKIIAYTKGPPAELRQEAIKAGAATCVRLDDLEAAIHAVFLDRELGGAYPMAPIAARVVNRINVGIIGTGRL